MNQEYSSIITFSIRFRFGLLFICLLLGVTLACGSDGEQSSQSENQSGSANSNEDVSEVVSLETSSLPETENPGNVQPKEATPEKILPKKTEVPELLPTQETPTTNTIKPLSTTSPGELLPSLIYGGFGGGGGCDDTMDPEIQWGEYFPPTLNSDDETITFGQVLKIEGCNYPADEKISVTFIYPNNIIETGTTSASEGGYWDMWWFSLPGEPLGTYLFNVDSNSAHFEGKFFVEILTKPEILILCRDKQRENTTMLLVGFQPFEEVLVANYSTYLVGSWYTPPMDKNGAALFTFPEKGELVIAIGEDQYPGFDSYDGTKTQMLSAFEYIGEYPIGICETD